MTLLRSYLGQLRAKCRCSTCSQASRVTRVANATSPIGMRAFQTGTVLYTAIFAAATLVDGQQKKLRRERWDEALAVKKEEAKTAKEHLRERTRQVASKQFGVHEPLPDEDADRLLRNLESSLRAQLASKRCGLHEPFPNDEAYRLLRKLETSLRRQQSETRLFVPKRSAIGRSNGALCRAPLGSRRLEEDSALGCDNVAHSLRKRDSLSSAYSWDDSEECAIPAETTRNPDDAGSTDQIAPYVRVIKPEESRIKSLDHSDGSFRVRKFPSLPADLTRRLASYPEPSTGLSWNQEGELLTELTIKYEPHVGSVAPLIPSTQPVEFHHPQSPWRPWVKRQRKPSLPLWTPKKRSRVELATMTFIVKLLRESETFGYQEEELPLIPQELWSYASLSERGLENALQRLEWELIDTHPIPTGVYRPPPDIGLPTPRYDLEFETEVHVLNQQLERLGRRSLNWRQISRICSVLLQSPAPPNIQTLNILLSMFNHQQRPDLVDLAFDWMLDARLRPNELTHCQFLRSYRYRHDEYKFMTYISLMRGMKSGLLMADRTPDFLLPQMQGRVFPIHEGGSRMVQAVAPSPLVFQQIILGLINFCGIRQTWDVCQNFIAYGWGYSYACLRTLIHQSAVESAWDTGLRWWEEAEKLVAQGYPIPTSLYATMLAFYRIAENNEDYTKLLSEAEVRLGLSSSQIAELAEEREAWIMKGRTLEEGGTTDSGEHERRLGLAQS